MGDTAAQFGYLTSSRGDEGPRNAIFRHAPNGATPAKRVQRVVAEFRQLVGSVSAKGPVKARKAAVQTPGTALTRKEMSLSAGGLN